jgi:hypothetical protein
MSKNQRNYPLTDLIARAPSASGAPQINRRFNYKLYL